MYLAATQYLLGIRASFEGLTVKPCLPEELLPAVVTRRFRGRMYRITIRSNEDVEVVPIEDSAG